MELCYVLSLRTTSGIMQRNLRKLFREREERERDREIER